MSDRPNSAPNQDGSTPSPDVSLLLRAHAEQRWLSREVITVLRHVETRDGLPTEQLGAAFAYLEVNWLEAQLRASETDGAYDRLGVCAARAEDASLCEKALRYYSSVRVLREVVGRRVLQVLCTMADERTSTSV